MRDETIGSYLGQLAARVPAPGGGAAAAKSNPGYPDHAMFSATKDELKAMPEFKYSNN